MQPENEWKPEAMKQIREAIQGSNLKEERQDVLINAFGKLVWKKFKGEYGRKKFEWLYENWMTAIIRECIEAPVGEMWPYFHQLWNTTILPELMEARVHRGMRPDAKRNMNNQVDQLLKEVGLD